MFAYESFALARTLAVASPVAIAAGAGGGLLYGDTPYALGLFAGCVLAWLAHVEARNVRRYRNDRRKRVATPFRPRVIYTPPAEPTFNGISDSAHPALGSWGSPW